MSAKSKGEIKTVFQRCVEELQQSAEAASDPLQGNKVDGWPIAEGDWNGDVDDAAAMTAAFDRTEISQLYEQCLFDADSPGTSGDNIAMQVQSDYVAAREMAFRDAVASPVRRAMAAMARRLGHSSAAGVFGNGVLRYVQDVLRHGGRT